MRSCLPDLLVGWLLREETTLNNIYIGQKWEVGAWEPWGKWKWSLRRQEFKTAHNSIPKLEKCGRIGHVLKKNKASVSVTATPRKGED